MNLSKVVAFVLLCANLQSEEWPKTGPVSLALTGALPNDGISDADGIRSVLMAGRALFVPNGVWTIPNTGVVVFGVKNVTIIGESRDGAILQCLDGPVSAGWFGLRFINPNGPPSIKGYVLRNFTIEGVTPVGTNSVYDLVQFAGSVTNATIENVAFKHCRANAIRNTDISFVDGDEAAKNTTIRDCYFEDICPPNGGISSGGAILWPWFDGIVVDGNTFANLASNDHNHLFHAIYFGCAPRASFNATIVNNRSNGRNGDFDLWNVTKAVVSGNLISGKPGITTYGLAMTTCTNVSVSCNTITSASIGVLVASTNIVLSGNCVTTERKNNSAFGMTGNSQATCTGNIFESTEGHAVYIATGSSVSLNASKLSGCIKDTSSYGACVVSDNTETYVRVHGCTMTYFSDAMRSASGAINGTVLLQDNSYIPSHTKSSYLALVHETSGIGKGIIAIDGGTIHCDTTVYASGTAGYFPARTRYGNVTVHPLTQKE